MANRTVGGRERAVFLALALAARAAQAAEQGPAPSSGGDEAILEACANEAGILCAGKTGKPLIRCLGENSGSATGPCRAKLRGLSFGGAPAEVWGSEAAARTSSQGVEVEISTSADASGRGFDVSVEDEPVFYPVSGSRRQDLVSQLNSSDIIDSVDGKTGAAKTGFSIGVSYARAMRADGCAAVSARVRVKVTETLPRWDAPAEASQELKDWWRLVISVIKTHEDGHRAIDVEAGWAVLESVKTALPMPACRDVDDIVGAAVHRRSVEAMQKNVAYDEDTGHGRKQFEEAFKRALKEPERSP